MVTMRQGAQALKVIHGQLDVTKIEDTMEDVRDQMEITQEIANAISDPLNIGVDALDEVCVDRLRIYAPFADVHALCRMN